MRYFGIIAGYFGSIMGYCLLAIICLSLGLLLKPLLSQTQFDKYKKFVIKLVKIYLLVLAVGLLLFGILDLIG